MSAAQTILDLLDAHGELYGLQLVKLSEGRLGRGTVYVHLSRLEDEGLVSSREEDDVPDARVGLRRRLYKITPQGRRARTATASDFQSVCSTLIMGT